MYITLLISHPNQNQISTISYVKAINQKRKLSILRVLDLYVSFKNRELTAVLSYNYKNEFQLFIN